MPEARSLSTQINQEAVDLLCSRIAQEQDSIPEPDYPGDASPWANQYEHARLDGLLLALTTLLGWPEQPAPEVLEYVRRWREAHPGVSSEFCGSDRKQQGGTA